MFTSNTVDILKSFDKSELKRFGDFIKSPYFNNSKPLEKIFDVVQKSYPSLEEDSLSFKKVFKKLYPSEIYSEKRIKNLYSDFSNLLRRFLAHEYLTSNKEMTDVCITTELIRKNLNNISEKIIAKSIKENDDGLLSAADRFHYLYRMNENHSLNLGLLRRHNSPEFLESDIELIEKLTVFFLTKILQLSFYDIMNHKFFKINENPILKEVAASIDTERIIKYLELTENEYSSYLKIHYLFFYYTTHDISEENYLELKKLILETIRRVKKSDQNNFLTRMIHIVVSRLSLMNRKYYHDIIEFADLIHELQIFPEEDINAFNNGPFRDIFITALSLKKYDWAENFLNEHMQHVNKELRRNSENYCRGMLSFQKGNFEESLNYLNEVKLIDIVEKLNIRFYYLMNYIELKSYESALSAMQSLKQFIIENKDIPESFSEGLQLSIKFFNEILKSCIKNEKVDEWIYKEAISTERFFQKQYIKDKMKSMI